MEGVGGIIKGEDSVFTMSAVLLPPLSITQVSTINASSFIIYLSF